MTSNGHGSSSKNRPPSDFLANTLQQRIIWTLRVCARRDRALDVHARRLSKEGLQSWLMMAGRLHDGDFVGLLVENNAALHPLALRPLRQELCADVGRALLHEALDVDQALLTASTANFLEAAALAFGHAALPAARRASFEAIRSQEQRILELPSTAARVAAMVAPPGAPLENYVGYVVGNEDDEFLVGLAMLEFDRNAMPTLVRLEDLQAGTLSGIGSFSRAATLGGEEDLLALLPAGMVQRVITL